MFCGPQADRNDYMVHRLPCKNFLHACPRFPCPRFPHPCFPCQHFHVRVFHVRIFHVRVFHVRVFHVGVSHVRVFHVRVFHVRVFHVRVSHVRVFHVRVFHVRVFHVRVFHVRVFQITTSNEFRQQNVHFPYTVKTYETSTFQAKALRKYNHNSDISPKFYFISLISYLVYSVITNRSNKKIFL